MPESKPKLKPAIRDRLDPVVLDVFSGGDFHQVNMRQIAKEAKVGYATIYRHFKSKDQLLFWFVDYWMSDMIERIIDHLQGMEDVKEKIRKILWLQLDYYGQNPKVGEIVLITVPLKTWMQDRIFRQERLMNILLGVLEEGQEKGTLDPSMSKIALLDVVQAMTGKTIAMWIYRGQKGDLQEQAATLFTLIWRAIRNPEHTEP